MNIPKISHRCWFGDSFPEKYKSYLIGLAELNPDYTNKLWSDPVTMSPESHEELKQFCIIHRIELCNIRDNKELENHELIIEELDSSLKTKTHQRLHYVRASDIARVAVLLKEGGIYTDTDSEMRVPFGELSAMHGVLLKKLGIYGKFYNYFKVDGYFKRKHYEYYFSRILYDFIACTPSHLLLKMAAQITALDYRTYHKSSYRAWENSFNKDTLTRGTIKLTGGALKFALNHLYQSGQFQFANPAEIFMDTDNMLTSDFDKSWLTDIKNCETIEKTVTVLEDFLTEIDEERLEKFTMYNHGEHPGVFESESEEDEKNEETLDSENTQAIPFKPTNIFEDRDTSVTSKINGDRAVAELSLFGRTKLHIKFEGKVENPESRRFRAPCCCIS